MELSYYWKIGVRREGRVDYEDSFDSIKLELLSIEHLCLTCSLSGAPYPTPTLDFNEPQPFSVTG